MLNELTTIRGIIGIISLTGTFLLLSIYVLQNRVPDPIVITSIMALDMAIVGFLFGRANGIASGSAAGDTLAKAAIQALAEVAQAATTAKSEVANAAVTARETISGAASTAAAKITTTAAATVPPQPPTP